ncbi:MAG: hypothetical protein GC155_12155 [Alphaproteobacteria bacterium]|nr:hypothetical protein [Alphaproteobacteria bacterium]
MTDPAEPLLENYRPLPGVSDELLDANGQVRPVWRDFIDYFARMGPQEVAERFARGDQYLRDAGVFFRQYGQSGSTERAWPLNHVPVLIHDSEWKTICEGLIQRADLLDAVAADLYGENHLVAQGHLPASLVGMSPEWLRPMVGIKPRSGHYLHFMAFEIGRGPGGQWWVLGDRVQAPSGAGFALENRVATARVFADYYADANIRRLAGFFRSFKESLEGLRSDETSPVGILTPGRLNDTYFEHAYIARYLGFMLLEGEDLTVENGEVMVRTITGLRPVSVLWRRIDAAYADPLELDETSRLGTPGLVQSVRQGNLDVVNALGAGVLETRAFLAFMPRICQALRGEPLKLPNIATWWCGQTPEREYVRANAANMMLSSALSTHMPFDAAGGAVPGSRFRTEAGAAFDHVLDTEGPMLVGQETVTLSTTPAHIDGQLVPRPMSLRVFLARTPNGWEVMPGGYARIGGSKDAGAIAMQRGGSVADMWVVSDKPVPVETMLPSPASPYVRAQLAVLPTRAADNLYWMGRYVERAEGMMRLMRAWHTRLAETEHPQSSLLTHAGTALELMGADPTLPAADVLGGVLASAMTSASQVRDRFSVDGWTALNDLSTRAGETLANVAPGDPMVRALNVLLRKITGFTGLVDDNMYRSTAWRFLSIGRSLERAMAMASQLAWFAEPGAPDGSLDFVVEAGDSAQSHRRLFAVTASRNTVVDILACDALNPRSMLFQLGEIKDHVNFLPGAQAHGHMSGLARAALSLHAGLAVRTPELLDAVDLLQMRSELAALSDLLTATYLR